MIRAISYKFNTGFFAKSKALSDAASPERVRQKQAELLCKSRPAEKSLIR